MKLLTLKNLSRRGNWLGNANVKDFLRLGMGCILAGGACRDGVKGRKIEDYDLFFTNSHAKDYAKNYFAECGYKLVFACPQGMLYTYKLEDTKIQLIHKRNYESVDDLLSSFDFSICQFASTDGETIMTSRQAVNDNKKKILTLSNLEYPVATINRIAKYKAKGFYAGDAIKSIVRYLALMNPNDYDESKDVLYID